VKLLLWLYPRRWRRRYLREMEAVLEHEPRSLMVCADLLRGALDAHLRASTHRPAITAPISAALALAGGAALVVAAGRLAGARAGILVGAALGLIAAGAILRRLRRPPRRRRGDEGDSDPGQGAPVPRKPLPGGPSLGAATLRLIRFRRRLAEAEAEHVYEEVEPEYQETTIRQRFTA
jgi:hypothetical protein